MADEVKPAVAGAAGLLAPTAPLDVTGSADRSETAADTASRPRRDGSRGGGSRGSAGWRAIDQGPSAKPWRVLSIVLLVLGCVLAPIGVTAGWAKNLVVNQDDYLAAVAPLITDPVIIGAAETRLVAGIDEAITNLQLADQIGDELQSLGLPPKLASLATSYLATFRTDITAAVTNMVDQLLTSPKLATIWNDANAAAHTKFVQIMQGQDPGRLHTINVDISSAVGEIKQKLQSSGVSWAANIPDVPVVFNIAENADVQMIAGYYDLLNTLGTWLPIIAALLLVISILIAPSRLGGLSKAAGWLAFSMVVLTLGLLAGREWLVSRSPTQPAVTEAFTKQLTVSLQGTIRLIVVVAAVISVVAWLFGRSRSAVGLRAAVLGLTDRVQDSRWNIAVRVGAGVIALILVLVLISLDGPSLVWAVLLAVLAGLGALIAASPPRRTAPALTGAHADVGADHQAGVPG